MNDKHTPTRIPHLKISVQIGIAPNDILPLLQAALTGTEFSENDTETIHEKPSKEDTQ